MTNALKIRFSRLLVFLLFLGVANILIFRKLCHFGLQKRNVIDDKKVKEFAEGIKTQKIQFDSNNICEGYSDI